MTEAAGAFGVRSLAYIGSAICLFQLPSTWACTATARRSKRPAQLPCPIPIPHHPSIPADASLLTPPCRSNRNRHTQPKLSVAAAHPGADMTTSHRDLSLQADPTTRSHWPQITSLTSPASTFKHVQGTETTSHPAAVPRKLPSYPQIATTHEHATSRILRVPVTRSEKRPSYRDPRPLR